ncbi:MAG: class I SAM-dependent rRNA methyltransferase [Nitrospirae bacterium]|nr:class I SAM-dependent rRNA methyltransferase [Nitrospirota bacterium]
MEKIYLKRTSRVNAGHLWIFSNELESSPKNYEPGSIVEVYGRKEGFIGIGYVNPNSLISIRLLTKNKEEIDAGFFRNRIKSAIAYRERFFPESDSGRIVFSEGDFIPGLIVDRYASCLSVQILTAGIEKQSESILQVLDELFNPSAIVLRNDSQSRTLEGLPLNKSVVKGNIETLPVIHEGVAAFEVDPLNGQKTGFFLDQRENRLALKKLIKGGEGLDLCCYSGGWGVQLALSGAEVNFVDDSDSSLSMAKRNVEINGLQDRCDFVQSDVFDFMKAESKKGSFYDFIVLDPPAFVKSRLKIKEALKGYRVLNHLAMSVLRPGGILATSSCSYHIEKQMFLDVLKDSAKEANRTPRLIEMRSQSKDHPILLSVPETEYLKCAFIAL